jgi:flagellar assembly factor FliW
MPRIPTKFLGEVDYAPDTVFTFPSGLPGFEEERAFLFLKIPDSEPLMFLQSLKNRNLCFALLPILTVAPDFRVELSPEELVELELPEHRQPALGKDVLLAALICAGNSEEVPCANLMSPVVVNLKTRVGLQVIHPESGYSHRHQIVFEALALAC